MVAPIFKGWRRLMSLLRYHYLDVTLPRPDHATVQQSLPVMESGFPFRSDGGEKIVIFTVCDPVYYREHAAAFIGSLRSKAPDYAVHLHLINPDAENKAGLARWATNSAAGSFFLVLGARAHRTHGRGTEKHLLLLNSLLAHG